MSNTLRVTGSAPPDPGIIPGGIRDRALKAISVPLPKTMTGQYFNWRTLTPDENIFWKRWQIHKLTLLERGYNVRRNKGEWQVRFCPLAGEAIAA
jgi:hypothetical protein